LSTKQLSFFIFNPVAFNKNMFTVGSHRKSQSQENKMDNQEILKAIAVLADKVGRYHERLMALERDNKKLENDLSTHKKGCSCQDTSKETVMLAGVATAIGTSDEVECEASSA
jgi:transcriptional regulator with GAF, ATPase, and Fis domain